MRLRLSGLCIALSLIVLSVAPSFAVSTYAQTGSPVPIDSTDDDAPGDPQSTADEETSIDEVEPADAPGNTPAGSSVAVTVLPDLYLTFGSVISGGNTSAYDIAIEVTPPLPDGFRTDNPRIVQIETTATFQYNIIVCVIYDLSSFANPSNIELLWLNGGSWENVTNVGNYSTACGYVAGLGTFAVAEFGTPPTVVPTETFTPLPTETVTSIPSPTETATVVPSDTPTPSNTATNTPTSTFTNTPIPSETPKVTASATPTGTPSPTPTATKTHTPLPSETNTPIPTATRTATPTETSTLQPADTNTPLPTKTSTLPPTGTATATPTASLTVTSIPSSTATGTSTATTIASATATPIPTHTATATSSPTATASPSASLTSTALPTQTPSVTSTSTETATPATTSSYTPSPTETATSTQTSSPVFTATPTVATGQTQFALPNVWVTFSLPPTSGTTHGTVVSGGTLPALPALYTTGSAWFVQIESSVVQGNNKQICVLFPSTEYANPVTVTLLRLNGSTWSPLNGQTIADLDSTQGTICGYTAAFGTFALAERTPPTATVTLTPSSTRTPSSTPSNTATSTVTPIPSATLTSSATPTASSTPSATAPPSATPSSSATNTPSATSIASVTTVPSKTPTQSPSPSSISTSTATASASPTSSATATASPSATSSQIPSSTSTSSPSATATATQTPTLAPGSYPTGTTMRTTTRVNLRSGPTTSSSSLGTVASGIAVTVTGASVPAEGRTWVPVTVPGMGAGWIAGNYLVVIPAPTPTRTPAPPTVTRTPGSTTPTRTPTRAPGAFIAGDFVRTTSSVNLRTAAGTSSQVLLVLPSKAIGQVTGPGVVSGGKTFYPVLFEGRPAGYVVSTYLQRVTATPTPTRTVTPMPTFSGSPVRFTNNAVNMRSGPGTGYRVVEQLPEGTRVNITGAPRSGGGYEWYPVSVYGIGSGWVAGKFLSTTGPV